MSCKQKRTHIVTFIYQGRCWRVSVVFITSCVFVKGLPWELLYADDLVLVAQSKEELRVRVL